MQKFPLEDALTERVVPWLRKEVEIWNHRCDSTEEFDFKAVAERFRNRGLAMLNIVFEELIQCEPLYLPKGAGWMQKIRLTPAKDSADVVRRSTVRVQLFLSGAARPVREEKNVLVVHGPVSRTGRTEAD